MASMLMESHEFFHQQAVSHSCSSVMFPKSVFRLTERTWGKPRHCINVPQCCKEVEEYFQTALNLEQITCAEIAYLLTYQQH